jgi:hypothetical protein
VINISFTAAALASDPIISVADHNFVLQLGPVRNVLIPRDTSNPLGNPLRNGSGFQLQLRLNESISLEDTEFQVLIENATGGGDVSFLNRLITLVARNIIQVNQDETTPALTSKQILAYTAP